MKTKSLKVKMQEIAKGEMQTTKGGVDSDSEKKLKTVVITGKKKNAELSF